jgi:F-type H+-transporting ATPase subunit b
MVNINFTIVIELGLFLLFLWLTNKTVVRPLLRTMDARQEKIDQDKAAAETERQEAKRLEALYLDRLTAAHQEASQRLHKARFDAYQEGRHALDDLRGKSEREVDVYSAAVQDRLDEERRKIEEMLPALVELADQKVNKEGSLL